MDGVCVHVELTGLFSLGLTVSRFQITLLELKALSDDELAASVLIVMPIPGNTLGPRAAQRPALAQRLGWKVRRLVNCMVI